MKSLFENHSKFYVVDTSSAQALLQGFLVPTKLKVSGLANPRAHEEDVPGFCMARIEQGGAVGSTAVQDPLSLNPGNMAAAG